mgnify:CR=1 FL=1
MCLWRSIQPISAHKNIHKTLGDNSNHKAISKTSYFANNSNRWTPAPINQQSGSRKMAIWFSDASLCRTSFPAKSSIGFFSKLGRDDTIAPFEESQWPLKKKGNKNFYWRLQSVIAIQFKCPVAVESDGSVIVSSDWLAPMVAKLRKSLGRFSDRA